MSKINELEKEIKKKNYKKSIFNTLKDTMEASIGEAQNSVANIFTTPSKWQNQISKRLEKFEKKVIKKRNKF